MYNVDHQVKQTKIQYIFLLPTFITKLYTMNCQSGFLSSVYEIKKRWCALLTQAKPAGWWAAAPHKSRARRLSIRRNDPAS